MGAPIKHSHKLLDSLIESNGLKNDSELALALNMAPPRLSKIRNGANEVSADFILAVHEKFGTPVAMIRALLS